jgi:methanethiol S-methyltransferase
MTNRVLTFTHPVFALVTTAYILFAIQLEERDLMKVHPEYATYREQVPMLVPGLSGRKASPRALAIKVATDSGGLIQP